MSIFSSTSTVVDLINYLQRNLSEIQCCEDPDYLVMVSGLDSTIDLQMSLIWFAPESPRWLISKNRDTEALKTLAQLWCLWHENNKIKKKRKKREGGGERMTHRHYSEFVCQSCVQAHLCHAAAVNTDKYSFLDSDTYTW